MRKNGYPSRHPALLVLVFASFLFTSCVGWRYGSSQPEAQNKYMLITGNKENFGDHRLQLHREFHKYELRSFLQIKGQPGFIYEYSVPKKKDAICMYYPSIDSVYVFVAVRRFSLHMALVESRRMNDEERRMYEQLKQGAR